MRNQGVLCGFLVVIVDKPAALKKWLFLQIDWHQRGAHFSVKFLSLSSIEGGGFCNTFYIFSMPFPHTSLTCSFCVWEGIKHQKKRVYIRPPPSTLLFSLKQETRQKTNKTVTTSGNQTHFILKSYLKQKSSRRHPTIFGTEAKKKQSKNLTHFSRACHRKPTAESRKLERVHCSLQRKKKTIRDVQLSQYV